MSLDTSVFNWFFVLGHKINADWLFIFLGQYLPYLMGLIFIWLLGKQLGWKNKIYISGFLVITELLSRGIITQTIRFIYHRNRPFVALGINPIFSVGESASFPSGHAVFFFSLALATFLMNRKWGWIMIAMAALVSLARIIAGVHWPLDIISGAVLSLIVFWLGYLVFPKEKYFNYPKEEKSE